MAELYPNVPRPSMVASPEVLDPLWTFTSDYGYEVRRPRSSRARFRYTLEYLGKSVEEVRIIRDFCQRHRLGALDFPWIHPTAVDVVEVRPTTPVELVYVHGLVTGQWVFVTNSPNPSINGGFWQVTLFAYNGIRLNNSVAQGILGVGQVQVYLPHAVARFQSETWAQPATLIGPDQLPYTPGGQRTGYYNFQVQVEEVF
jgi:hypothetical protein